MSDAVGLVSVLPRPGSEQPLLPGADSGGPSESTRELVDAEVRRIVDECYVKALDRLRENRDRLDSLAKALLAKETLNEREAYAAAGFDRPAEAPAEPAKV
jgi:cell division protease FtsH